MSETHYFEPEIEQPKRAWPLRTLLLVFVIDVLLVLFCLHYLNQPPATFASDTRIEIAPGTPVQEITVLLKEQDIVRSSTFLYFLISLLHDPAEIKASTYVFDKPLTANQIAVRLTEGEFGNDLLRITHIEGETVVELAELAEQVLPNFDRQEFVSLAIANEGKLFPDTYFVPATFTAPELYDLLIESFHTIVAEYEAEIEAHPLSLEEIIILASIIEREANSEESMKLVSSVLQNRINIGMPLQADASIEYILDKPLSQLTPADLKIDSPYNTYTNPGLPPTPIGNPGRTSIEAVLRPADSDYFYYITDENGTFHYAETYQQHLSNIERYLR